MEPLGIVHPILVFSPAQCHIVERRIISYDTALSALTLEPVLPKQSCGAFTVRQRQLFSSLYFGHADGQDQEIMRLVVDVFNVACAVARMVEAAGDGKEACDIIPFCLKAIHYVSYASRRIR